MCTKNQYVFILSRYNIFPCVYVNNCMKFTQIYKTINIV